MESILGRADHLVYSISDQVAFLAELNNYDANTAIVDLSRRIRSLTNELTNHNVIAEIKTLHETQKTVGEGQKAFSAPLRQGNTDFSPAQRDKECDNQVFAAATKFVFTPGMERAMRRIPAPDGRARLQRTVEEEGAARRDFGYAEVCADPHQTSGGLASTYRGYPVHLHGDLPAPNRHGEGIRIGINPASADYAGEDAAPSLRELYQHPRISSSGSRHIVSRKHRRDTEG